MSEQGEPTQERMKEFWKGYGFEWLARGSHDKFHQLDAIRYPDGTIHSMPPDTDLNNLFRYAVPKALEKIGATSNFRALQILFRMWLDKYWELRDLEDALFWVLWQVKENSNEQAG